MQYFIYGEDEITFLKKRDPILGTAIDRLGLPDCQVIPDLFTALVNSVVAQQISTKATETVWGRMLDCYGGDITADRISRSTQEEVQKFGMSRRKAGYIKGIADAIASGRLDVSALAKKSDDQIIKELITLPGIGVWTAEMALLHSLERPDVLSWNDHGIRRGIMRLYHMDTLSKNEFAELRRRYTPYGSIASIYIWAVAHAASW
ncbi:MAG: DNA-3-methyladenine glycosylase 2 family protein [Methanocalculaceae archaeon]|nr:DNA-3-methyladenine glycosylase 2 family protein [Methanocalculaceae archaeon]